jgi:predicted nucleic acid-binding protein
MSISKNGIALLDTNIIVYAADTSSPFHQNSKNIRDNALLGNIEVCVCPQVLMEFFAILTDSKRVKNQRAPEEVIAEMEKNLSSKKNISMIYPKRDTLPKTIELLGKYNLKRQTVFDAQLVATMLSNNVTRIYTYNQDDFLKFEEIEVLLP